MAFGSVIALLLSVQEGEIRACGTVRNAVPQVGMGVEITAMSAGDGARYLAMVQRLLDAQHVDAARLQLGDVVLNPAAN